MRKIDLLTLITLFVTLFLLSSHQVHGANTKPIVFDNPNTVFFTLNHEQGLSQPSILAMAKDSLGYTWVGTQAGLNRYDGNRFEQYSFENKTIKKLTSQTIWKLCTNQHQQLWIGSNSGLVRYNYLTGRETLISTLNPLIPEDKIIALSCEDEKIVFNTDSHGLYVINASDGSIIKKYSNQVLNVRKLHKIKQHTIAVGTSGVHVINHHNHKITQLSTNEAAAVKSFNQCIYIAFVSKEIGCYSYDDVINNTPSSYRTIAQVTGSYARDIVIHNHFLWASSRHGLYQFTLTGNLVRHYRKNKHYKYGLSDDGILGILPIDDHHMLLGTNTNGISQLNLNSHRLGHINHQSFNAGGQFSDNIYSIAIDNNNRLWLGTTKGLYIYSNDKISKASTLFPELHPFDEASIISLYIKDNDLWIGSSANLNGIQHFNFNNKVLTDINHRNKQNPMYFSSITEFQGTLYATGLTQGIYKKESTTNQLIPYLNTKLPKVTFSTHSYKNSLWLTTLGSGLIRIKDNNINTFSLENDAPTNTFYSLYHDEYGRTWAASDNGIVILNDDMALIAHITTKDGLPSNSTWSIIADDNKHMWLGTSNGLSKIHIDDFTITNFGIADGIQSLEYTANTTLYTDAGQLFIAGTNGFNQYFPNTINSTNYRPNIFLSGLSILGKKTTPINAPNILNKTLEYTKALHLTHQQDTLSLTYTAINYNRDKLTYYYRVLGLSDQWFTMPLNSRQVNLIKIPPGKYTVETYIKNYNNKTSSIHRLRLNIAPPWYWNVYSQLFYLLIAILCCYLIYRVRQRSYHKLERLVEDRTLALSAKNKALESTMNDLKLAQSSLIESEKLAALGNLVAGVAHEINTPLGIAKTATTFNQDAIALLKQSLEDNTLSRQKLVSNLDKQYEAYRLILSNLERAIHLIVNFKQVAADQHTEIQRTINIMKHINETVESMRPLLRNTGIEVIVSGSKDLSFNSYPGPLYRIISNLIKNSIIHGFEGTKQGVIDIEIRHTNSQVIIIYRDNGKGVDKTVKDSIYQPFVTTKRHQGGTGLGMHIVHNLITQVFKGTIKYCDNDTNEGVKFIIKLPIDTETTS